MPDIKTALASALKEWDTGQDSTTKEDKQMQTKDNKEYGFQVTSNVGRRTFAHVHANKGIKPHEITAWAKTQGLNPDSAYAVAAKSVRDGYMARTKDGGFYTLVPEYQPPKTKAKTKKNPVPAKPHYTVKQNASKGIEALIAEPQKEPELTNDYILARLDVRQALSLYRELISIFTGKM